MTFNKELWNKMNEYKDYLVSEDWEKLKVQRFQKDEHKCMICKSGKIQKAKLVCHHITYTRLFNEEIDDLITLCMRCHSKIHRASPPKNLPDFAKQNVLSIVFQPSEKEMEEELLKLRDKMWEER